MNVIELRNYLLKPGVRDKFISYFKDHFSQSQNEMGAYTPCQFRIKNQADRFFWIRGFDNMKERSRFLPSFYGGEIWKAFGPAANDMMLEWHHVHLLKPINGNIHAFDKSQGLLVFDYYTAADNQLDLLIELFTQTYIPVCQSYGINSISLWVGEMEENDFPMLPVYQEENLLVVITGYNTEEEYKEITERSNSMVELSARVKELVTDRQRLVLYPA